MAAPGLVSPDSYPIRQPTDKSQISGRICNPPRYYEVGGLSSAAVWHREVNGSVFAQSPQTNQFRVEKPTSVKSAHKSSRESD
jgi:hypothetical protein